jgi:hypothetical protein
VSNNDIVPGFDEEKSSSLRIFLEFIDRPSSWQIFTMTLLSKERSPDK